jgi:prephenate dehydrogenase
MLNNKKIVIVGLGLMGASLGLALRKKFPRAEVIGVSRSRATIQKAKRKGIIHRGTTRLEEAIPQADWVVLSTPLFVEIPTISSVDRLAKPGTVVTDVGSVKGRLTSWVQKQRFRNISFVGAHPMAGSHSRGLEAAQADLYGTAVCFVIRGKKTNTQALQKTVRFWKSVCRRVATIDAKTHDKVVARVSHLPHVAAALLLQSMEGTSLAFAGQGLRDTTRIAQGDPGLWQEIMQENRANVAHELRTLQRAIGRFLALLQKGKKRQIFNILHQASQKRKKLNSI